MINQPTRTADDFSSPAHKSSVIPCENLVPLEEAGNDFVGHAGKPRGLSKSSAEGVARDVKNFRRASFSFGSFSFGRTKENEHLYSLRSALGFTWTVSMWRVVGELR